MTMENSERIFKDAIDQELLFRSNCLLHVHTASTGMIEPESCGYYSRLLVNINRILCLFPAEEANVPTPMLPREGTQFRQAIETAVVED